MKCEDCLPLIEEYVDGELDGRTMERLAAHLSTCASCEQELATLQREQEIYANYRRDLEVTPAQWNIIQARIEQEKDAPLPTPRTPLRLKLAEFFGSGKQFRPGFAAALVLLVVGIIVGVIYLNSRSRQPEIANAPQPIATPAPAGVKPAPPSESNRSDAAIASRGNQEQSNSNRQPSLATNNPAATKTAAGQKKNAAVIARHPRVEKPVVKGQTPDESAQIETIAAGDNPLNDVRHSAPDAAGDFDFEIARHAERAELLLRSFRNVRLPDNTRSLDVSYEKAQSRKLLYQNIALRREAGARGDQPATEVLNTLEPILLDIANLPSRAKARDVRSIEQHMEKKEIVATLQVRTLVASN
jgi:hypothetical protein